MNDGQDEALLGVKWAELLLRAVPYWLSLSLLGGLAGAVIGFRYPLPFVSTALVAVGETWKDRPIETPIVIAQRLEGFGRDAAETIGPSKLTASARMDRRYQGRVIDVRVESSDPEVARRVLTSALDRIVELHASFAAFENRTSQEFVEFSDRRAEVIEKLLETVPPEDLSLGSALIAARRGHTDMGIPIGGAIVPMTRVLRRASSAVQSTARWKLLGASGGIAGALIGFLIFLLGRSSASTDAHTRRVRALVAKPLAIGALVGAVVGGLGLFASSSHWMVRGVVLLGRLGGVGSIQETDEVIESAKQAFEDARPSLCTSEPCDLSLEVLPIRATPSDDVKTDVIELRATSTDRESADQAIQTVILRIESEQTPYFEQNYDRYRRHIEQIQRDIAQFEGIEDQSRVDQEHLFGVMREYTKNERNLSPARSYPPEQLGALSFEQLSGRQRWAAVTLLLAALGSSLGLAFAFAMGGWRRIRDSASS